MELGEPGNPWGLEPTYRTAGKIDQRAGAGQLRQVLQRVVPSC